MEYIPFNLRTIDDRVVQQFDEAMKQIMDRFADDDVASGGAKISLTFTISDNPEALCLDVAVQQKVTLPPLVGVADRVYVTQDRRLVIASRQPEQVLIPMGPRSVTTSQGE